MAIRGDATGRSLLLRQPALLAAAAAGSWNALGSDGGTAIADALCRVTCLQTLDLGSAPPALPHTRQAAGRLS